MIANVNRTDFLSVGQACREFGLSAPSIRKLVDEHPELAFRTMGSHRRLSRKALSEHLGLNSPSQSSSTPLALVVRVSGSNQARKSSPNAECSSLDHQIKRVEDFATERFGASAVSAASRYYRVGGGLNHEHPILVQLISDILHGKFRGGYICCQDSIRLMRFGNAIFEQICQFGECEIVYAMEVDRSDAEVDLSESILSILCHFTAKASGMRAKRILEICVSEEDLVRIYRQYKQGCSYVDLAKFCKAEGIQGEKGQELSPAKLHQLLSRNQRILEELVPDVSSDIGEFISGYLLQSDGTLTKQVAIYDAYLTWTKTSGKTPMSAKKLGLALKGAGFESGKGLGGMKCWKNVVVK